MYNDLSNSSSRFRHAGAFVARKSMVCFGAVDEACAKGIQSFQWGKRRRSVLVGLKNGQQAAAFFRQLSGLLGHHPAVIDLNFQRQIAHSCILAGFPPIANQICESGRARPSLENLEFPDTVAGRRCHLEWIEGWVDWKRPGMTGDALPKGQSLQATFRRGWYFGSEAFGEKLDKR